MEVELKKEDRELLKSVIDKMNQTIKPKKEIASEKTEKTESNDAHKHWKASEVLTSDCPECEKQADEIIRETMRKRRADKEKYPVKCVECGTPVKREEKDCPTCGGTDATERS